MNIIKTFFKLSFFHTQEFYLLFSSKGYTCSFIKILLKNLCHPYSKLTSLIYVATEVSLPLSAICILCTKLSLYQDPTKNFPDGRYLHSAFYLSNNVICYCTPSSRPTVSGESGTVLCAIVTLVMNDTFTYVGFKGGTTLYITKRWRQHFT
jgi:uncharacterized protein YhhL (DUF1145 family)